MYEMCVLRRLDLLNYQALHKCCASGTLARLWREFGNFGETLVGQDRMLLAASEP